MEGGRLELGFLLDGADFELGSVLFEDGFVVVLCLVRC